MVEFGLKGQSREKRHLPFPLDQPRKQRPDLQEEREGSRAGVQERKQQRKRDKKNVMADGSRTPRTQLNS